jgi:hypothetical protein
MTRIENRLRDALAAEAETHDVDVLRLREELNDRLGHHHPRRGLHRRRVLPGLAAAVLLVAGAAVGGQLLFGGTDSPETAASEGVDDTFSCPGTRSVDLSGAQDEFLPDISRRTPAEVAKEYGAPRWEFVEDGDTARLLLGNADGTLGSATRYERRDGDWQMVGSQACANGTPAAPTSDALRLGVHESDPWPAEGGLEVGNPRAEPVLVDDRPVYDHSGLADRHRSIYVAPCGPHVCLAVGEPTSVVLPRFRTFSGRDAGVLGTTCSFFTPDDMVGRRAPYTLVVAWDALGRTTDLTVAASGDTHQGVSFTDPSWGPQQVWVALVPTPSSGVKMLSRLHDADGLVDQSYEPVTCD